MHLHEVLKIKMSFHAQSRTFNRPRLNSAHIGVACMPSLLLYALAKTMFTNYNISSNLPVQHSNDLFIIAVFIFSATLIVCALDTVNSITI